jgi:hypothetical protein
MLTEVIFVLGSMGRFAAHDVVSKQYNFVESELTLLDPRAVPDVRRLIVPDPSNPPLTSPKKSVMKIGTFGPCHITTTGVTLLRSPKQAHILQKFNGHNMVIEYTAEKQPVRTTICPRHPTPV